MNTKNNITEHNKKKKWVKPELKVLGFNKTAGGPGEGFETLGSYPATTSF